MEERAFPSQPPIRMSSSALHTSKLVHIVVLAFLLRPRMGAKDPRGRQNRKPRVKSVKILFGEDIRRLDERGREACEGEVALTWQAEAPKEAWCSSGY